ncbi:MAG: hypothetical protein ACK4RT_05540 [Erythrobacter sp.]
MHESRIAAGQLLVTATQGFPPEIDALAGRSLSRHGFLRAAWYRGGAERSGRTLLIRRGGGGIIAARPTGGLSPVIARTIDGSAARFLTAPHRSASQQVLGDRPIAFCCDLDDGPVRYGIAASHAQDMKRCDMGKPVNIRARDDAIAASHRPAARVMARVWGEEVLPEPQVELPQRMRARG